MPGIPPDGHEVYRRYISSVVLHGQASAAALGLNATDLYALNVLSLAGSLTSGALAGRTGLTTGATTRLIDRLERAGHIRRVPDPADRRRMFIEPAGPGLDVDEVMAPARRRIAEVLGSFTPDQQAALFAYFRLATDAYQEAIAELRAEDDASRMVPSPTR